MIRVAHITSYAASLNGRGRDSTPLTAVGIPAVIRLLMRSVSALAQSIIPRAAAQTPGSRPTLGWPVGSRTCSARRGAPCMRCHYYVSEGSRSSAARAGVTNSRRCASFVSICSARRAAELSRRQLMSDVGRVLARRHSSLTALCLGQPPEPRTAECVGVATSPGPALGERAG